MNYILFTAVIFAIAVVFMHYFSLRRLVLKDLMTGVKNRNAFEIYVRKLTKKSWSKDELCGEFKVSKGYAKIDLSVENPFSAAFIAADKRLYDEKRDKKDTVSV